MNKILLICFTALSFILASCSSDDNSNIQGNSKINVTIDGVQKTFNIVNVNVLVEEENYHSFQVTASINNDPSELIVINSRGDIGVNGIEDFIFNRNGTNHTTNTEGTFFNNITSTNDPGKFIGTFTGRLAGYNPQTKETHFIDLTNGSYEIYY